MTTHTLCFRSLIKKVTDVWNSEVDSMKKISKMADFQGTASWCSILLLVLDLDTASFTTSHTVVFSWFEQAIQAEYM